MTRLSRGFGSGAPPPPSTTSPPPRTRPRVSRVPHPRRACAPEPPQAAPRLTPIPANQVEGLAS
jgi:hypothetical protein